MFAWGLCSGGREPSCMVSSHPGEEPVWRPWKTGPAELTLPVISITVLNVSSHPTQYQEEQANDSNEFASIPHLRI